MSYDNEELELQNCRTRFISRLTHFSLAPYSVPGAVAMPDGVQPPSPPPAQDEKQSAKSSTVANAAACLLQ